ncbi:caspase family protein [Aliivibrio wodanis]|uniref:caspase family protein n=1 Tax=Aliivibrio wodanis TaxID=80852 RepID=UPI00406C1164
MKKLVLGLVIAASLTACSTIKEEKTPVSEVYLSQFESAFTINEPRVIFKNDTLIITPSIVSFFTQYQDMRIKETLKEKNPSGKNHFLSGFTTVVLFGLPVLMSLSEDYSMYPCDGDLNSKGKPYKYTIDCKTTISDKGIKKVELRDVPVKSKFNNSTLKITIESNKGVFEIPLSEDNQIHTSLQEIGNPAEFTVQVSYKGEVEEFDFSTPKKAYQLSLKANDGHFMVSNIKVAPEVRDQSFSPSKKSQAKNKLTEKQSFAKINSLVEQYLEQYIATVQKPSIPELRDFPEIPQPKLPEAPVLEKSQFETKAEFEGRVQLALDARNENIEQIQAQYRDAVELRNTELEAYLTEREERIEHLVNGYNSRLDKIDSSLDIAKIKFTGYAFQEVLGEPSLHDLNYDAENQLLYGTIKMSKSTYQEKVSIKVESKDAQYIYEKSTILPIKLSYKFVGNSVQIDEISVVNDEIQYFAKVNDTDFKVDDMRVVINTNKKLTKAEQFKVTDIASEKASALQNPNLTDKYSTSAVTYVRNQEISIGKKAFNDDIPTLLKKAKQRKISDKRWLFVIGIEDYAQTDNIKYSRRSAELFIQVAQKKLGVSKRNTYTLLDGEATVGKIKDTMSLMLRNIQEGDEIYFYYNGHGIPDPQDNNEPYLLASDKIPDFVTHDSYFKLENFYKQLANSEADKVVAFVDSCFSGATDGVSVIKGVAASRLAPKQVSFDQNKMVVMTAGSKKQYSNVYLDKGNRLFSYYVMKELLDGEKDMIDLYQDVRKNVRKTSLNMGDLKLQEPSLSGNKKLSI